MADIQSQLPIKITNGSNTVGISGNALVVDGSAVTQPVSIAATVDVSGTVTVSNFPVTQPVSGTVSVGNFPATQPVSGTVAVSNFPETQPISGTVAVSSVGGTVSVSSGEVSTGIIAYANTVASVVNGAVGTITYTVTNGKTFYLKQVHASASGGPCKVVVDYGAGPTQVAVGFFSASDPNFDLVFAQPISISAGVAVNVKITNSVGSAQDVYASIFGREV